MELSMMDRNRLSYILLFVITFVADGAKCQQEPTKDPSAECCPPEMCLHIFDRLEEETQRWRNLEEAFRRTVKLLSVDVRLTGLSEALKGDFFIGSLLDTPGSNNGVPTSNWESDPVAELLHSKRRKRETDNNGLLTSSERLAEALRWSKRGMKPQVDQQQINAQARMSQVSDIPEKGVDEVKKDDSLKKPSEETQSPLATQQFVREAISSATNNLQNAAKCALGQRNDLISYDNLGVLTLMNATLSTSENSLLDIEFELKTCHRHFSAVWIQLYERGFPVVHQKTQRGTTSSPKTHQVPKECLIKKGNSFFITLPSTKKSCSFPLMDLMECKVYNVEMIPIYQGFQGQSSITDITVPPKIPGDSTNLNSLNATSRQFLTTGVALEWSILSGDCAQLVTSVDVRIYDQGRANSSEPLSSYTVPSDCITKDMSNRFYIDNEKDSCYKSTGLPFERCRSYTLELQAEYSSTWKGKSSFVDLFTAGNDKCCYLHSSPSGSFVSNNYDGKFDCTWLISVEPNNTIWITFSQFQIYGSYYHVKVYDGPDFSSHLMLDHSESQSPEPIRSSTNKLLVQMARMWGHNQGNGKSFTASYSAVPNTGQPYAKGCGGSIKIDDEGTIVGYGTISKPAYPSSETSYAECLWYIEKLNPAHTIVLNSPTGKSAFPITVYDGWSSVNGRLIYNQPGNSSLKSAIYLSSNKTLIKFPAWNSMDRDRTYSWNVEVAQSTINGFPCAYELTSSSGTIKSPDYPSNYPKLIDCRWIIRTNATSKIRITFGYFDTVADYDFVTIYDGSSETGPVLYDMSGSMAYNIPDSVTSSSNLMTVRFTTSSGLRRQVSPTWYPEATTPSQSTTNSWKSGTSSSTWLYEYGTTIHESVSTTPSGPITYQTLSGTGFLALFSTIPCDYVSQNNS